MIRVNNLKIKYSPKEIDLRPLVASKLKINPQDIQEIRVLRKSLDTRRAPDLYHVLALDVAVKKEGQVLKKNSKNHDVKVSDTVAYEFLRNGNQDLMYPPVIIGSGPAGLFCGLMLARAGYRPILIERGKPVEERKKIIEEFWDGGRLSPQCNVQFGEGGAGTFSDGKLNTQVKDTKGRNRRVLEEFVKFGADPSILTDAKPHIGTDVLYNVLINLRREITDAGGQFRFDTCLTDIDRKDDYLELSFQDGSKLTSQAVVLAIGHSARDTFSMLKDRHLNMSPKAFAVGFRVEHPQTMVNEATYKGAKEENLPVAPYKVTAKTTSGRGVYSFCMCPGGYVVNASSEEGRLAVNGMSYHDRAGQNANSAIIIAVRPEDFPSDGPLSGMEFQRELEEKTYKLCQGLIPQQTYGDFKANQTTTAYGSFESTTKGGHAFANLRELLPEELNQAFMEGMDHFGRIIPGFNREDAILSAIESRTSSPVRMDRDEYFVSNIEGLYPCGEGAGYAGGIMSAAMDGLKVAEAIAGKYKPLCN